MLKGMHKGVTHLGKVPHRQMEKLAQRQREMMLEELRTTLAEVVASENFEAAAKVRDEISRIEAELEPPGAGA